MTIHIYQSLESYTAFALAPDAVIGFSSSTPAGALANLCRHQCKLPPHVTTFKKLIKHIESLKNTNAKLIFSFPDVSLTSFTSIREDFPEFFI